MRRPALARLAGHLAFVLLLAAGAAWTTGALWVQLEGAPHPGAGRSRRRLGGRAEPAGHEPPTGWLVLGLGALAAGLWFQAIEPRDDRDWAPDVAHGVTARIEGDRALRNVRAFDWTGPATARETWEERSYDLDRISGVDMLTSVRDSPDIAHLMVSFGFEDGRHLVFSVEIRRERDESFSVLGGFFRQFELVLIAADESDILRLRTHQRGEDLHLYPLALDAGQRRSLFLSYLGLGNELAARPAFYNTVTANCTSTVWRLAQGLGADLPLDWRLLLSGHLPCYLEDFGALPGEMPMEARRAAAAITARALSAPADMPFEEAIRTGLSGG
ncbi:Lnb N-terminal periplasmic domain-containing protein [Rhodobacter sp. NSM]|uniref:Lnb N-terminal periplasmic domain-containing protein n=1 Tax=Rhodobacter sp. NSM TaxID=3457501 RepID=UPI003FD2D5F5